MRKKRSDRNHIIYKITCLKTKETYIGLTLQTGQKKIGSAKIRLKSHVSKANNGGGWKLHKRIREIGSQYFVTEVITSQAIAFSFPIKPNFSVVFPFILI